MRTPVEAFRDIAVSYRIAGLQLGVGQMITREIIHRSSRLLLAHRQFDFDIALRACGRVASSGDVP